MCSLPSGGGRECAASYSVRYTVVRGDARRPRAGKRDTMSVQEAVDGLGQLINGEIVTNGDTFPVENPSTGEIIAQCLRRRSRWSTTPWRRPRPPGRSGRDPEDERVRSSGRCARRSRAASRPSTRSRRPRRATPARRRGVVLDRLRQAHRRPTPARRHPRRHRRPHGEGRAHTVGVVAAIAPWNAPVLILAEKIFTALLVGDTVVAKPSPFTPLGTLWSPSSGRTSCRRASSTSSPATTRSGRRWSRTRPRA